MAWLRFVLFTRIKIIKDSILYTYLPIITGCPQGKVPNPAGNGCQACPEGKVPNQAGNGCQACPIDQTGINSICQGLYLLPYLFYLTSRAAGEMLCS